jgi:hypothetical protein
MWLRSRQLNDGFSGGFMTPIVQAGTILIDAQPFMTQVLKLESEPYCGDWSVVKHFNGFTLDRKIRAAGWNFFFMAAEMKVMFFGTLGAQRIQNALKRILAKVRHQNYNGLEVTSIVSKHFLGIPYTTVSAHSRHVQQSCGLDSAKGRLASHHNADWTGA